VFKHLIPLTMCIQEPGECRTSMPVGTDRTIWYIVGDNFNIQKPWSICVFSGKSLSDLRSLLSDDCSAVLCVRAGPYGKWTPLFTDLPDNKDTLEILVLDGESAGERSLLF
jgi:hypothetical protein